ncbi:MAG: HlyC/CorC family transporter [Acidobacteria bacterium]|jgi:CBS domain containing-hemolysin-like protein|nr:HlyC/CorC family transporter [Acidobacteriota bacterium]OQB55842.1 MAG: Magnesium and cobalt efflux protein CorC [Candidatus Aminicenantes bacterium ADurb.Bin147]HNT31117.1 hemolysin family protein [Candidatus Aminicenantes bacterium]MDW3226481.1 hemolysin family protein [Acidobacteriota bacterium]NMD10971.1 HlyC/CorC family transporter [Acidobacteriota bacterium]
MEISTITWAGLGLCVLAASALSLFHITLSGYSKVGLSGFLEERNHPDRTRILDRYDDIKIAVEFWRMILIIALAVYAFLIFPAFRTRPLGLFLFSAVVYAVFFDIVPRLLAAAGRDRCLSRFLPSYRLFLSLSAPVLAFVRWLSVREEQKEEEAGPEDREAGEEEIETFLDEAEEEGIIEKGEDALLRNVVEFGDTIVREVMTPRVDMVCIRRDATIQKLRHLFIVEKYSRIPVYRDRIDGVDGLVMAKDLLAYSEKEFDEASIEPLVRPLLFVPESMKVADLLKELQKAKQKLAVVVDEHGGVSGLVTMEDVFEVIVGEIQDEYDAEEAQIVQNGPADYTVSGAAKVEEIEDLFDVELADDDFITVSGLVAQALGRLPTKGERLIIGRLIVDVLDVDQKRIKKLRMRKAADEEPEHAG